MWERDGLLLTAVIKWHILVAVQPSDVSTHGPAFCCQSHPAGGPVSRGGSEPSCILCTSQCLVCIVQSTPVEAWID